jgi:hypothetical protein
MDLILGFIIFSAFILFLVYKGLQKNSFKAPAVIIGNRKYYDVVNKLYVDVVDYNGTTVFFKFDIEFEETEIQTLPEKEFLSRFKKVGGKTDVGIEFIK